MAIVDQRFFRAPMYSGAYLDEIAFPLGGIGTGTISLCGNGALAEWQIQNKPNQDSFNSHTCFMLWAQEEGEEAKAKICEGPIAGPYNRHHKKIKGQRYPGGGLGDSGLFGLPRFEYATFFGAYPFAKVELSDPDMPVRVALEAYNPMIPMDADNSGIPSAQFRFTITNATENPVAISLLANAHNPLQEQEDGGLVNRYQNHNGIHSLVFENALTDKHDPAYGSVAIASDWQQCFYREYWHRLGWFDPIQQFWDEFKQNGTLENKSYDDHPAGTKAIGSLGMQAVIAPGESVCIPVWITWSFPNYRYGLGTVNDAGHQQEGGTHQQWINFYAQRFAHALDVVDYLREHEQTLYDKTWQFRQSLDRSSIDPVILAAITSQMSIIKSPTAIRLQDGTYYGYEGCGENSGCCPGSCGHVWNYAQAHAHLYPQLDMSMHDASYANNFSPSGSGAMAFRVSTPPEPQTTVPNPAVDAQMGEIIKCYQAWKITGDDDWLVSIWPAMKTSLDFAQLHWDSDQDGYIDGIQHNTYDIEFYGPNALAQSYYLGALSCAAEIAQYFDEQTLAEKYQDMAQSGAQRTDADLFNGEYYFQDIDPEAYKRSELSFSAPQREVPAMKPGEPKWQFGNGCLSDQLAGICLTRAAGAQIPLDPNKVCSALQSIYRHNFKANLYDHENCQRAFALQDEAALVLCTWPHGGRPVLPFIYCDEAWTGIEYQVAAHLLFEGMDEEALDIVRAVRARYDGKRRNPWNEFECGSYYARAMSSWSLLLASSGQINDAPHKRLRFALDKPTCGFFWSAQAAWGFISKRKNAICFEVQHGTISLQQLTCSGAALGPTVQLNEQTIKADVSDGVAVFADILHLQTGDILTIS